MSEGLAIAWAGAMWRASWQGAVLVLLVWALCGLFPRLSPAHRCWLWWLVCLRLVSGLLTLPPLTLAVLPPSPTAPVLPPASLDLVAQPAPAPVPHPEPAPGLSLADVLFVGWLAGVLFQGTRVTWSFLLIRRLRRGARSVETGWLYEEGARLSRTAGLRRPLPILVSAAVDTPMLVGPVAPALLLPLDAANSFPEAELRMALAHEIAHARRGDLWLSLVPGLVQVLFFFHPLAWLAGREWALTREAACDAEVLRLSETGPGEYGRFLLRLAGSSPAPSGALSATSGYRSLERRLRMLRTNAPATRRIAATGALLTGLVAVTLLPWQVTARAAASPTVHISVPSRPGEPRITGELNSPNVRGRRLRVAAPGPNEKPPVITAVTIQGATAFTQDELRKVIKTRAGEAFDPQRWQADQEAVSRLYRNKGYQVRLTPQGPENRRLTLRLEELRVGKLQFKWLQPELGRHAELVTEKVQQKAGVLYNVKQLQEDFRAVRALELFETINPMVEVAEDGKISVTWELGKKQ